MARIGIDATSISPSGKGVSRYQKNIVHALARLESAYEYYVFLNEASRIEPFVMQPNWHFIQVPIWKDMIWEQVQIPHYARKFRLDLMHVSHDRLPCLSPLPIVLFLFEPPHRRSEWATRREGKKIRYLEISHRLTLSIFPQSLRRARRIMVSSESTKNDLIKDFRVSADKIRVIYPGCEESFKPLSDREALFKIRREFNAPEGYLLHFSTGDPRENTDLVLRAFRQAKGRLPNGMKLILVGGSNRRGSLPEDVLCLPFLSGEPLIAVYQGARLYVDPSFYEGFGFQVLEAMACGVPVIATQRSAIPEILGSAGILVDPEDAGTLAEMIIRVLVNESLHREMQERGFEQAKEFRWERAARETLSTYEEVFNEH